MNTHHTSRLLLIAGRTGLRHPLAGALRRLLRPLPHRGGPGHAPASRCLVGGLLVACPFRA